MALTGMPIGRLATLATILAVTGCGGGNKDVSSVAGDEFRELERRPLDLPAFDLQGPGIREGGIAGRCLGSKETEVGAIGLPRIPGEAALGPGTDEAELRKGPVYVALLAGAPRIVHLSAGTTIGKSPWLAIPTMWVSRSSYDGPLLVRGGRIERPGRLGFGSRARPDDALRLPSGTWPEGELSSRRHDEPLLDGWRAVTVPTRVRTPGCYAFQVDGLGFSYVLSFGVQEF